MTKQLELDYKFKVGDRVITPTGRVGTVRHSKLKLSILTLVEFDEVKPRTKKGTYIPSMTYLMFTDILNSKS